MKESLLFSEHIVPVADFCIMKLKLGAKKLLNLSEWHCKSVSKEKMQNKKTGRKTKPAFLIKILPITFLIACKCQYFFAIPFYRRC